MSNGYQPGHDHFVAWSLEPTATPSSYGNWDSSDNPTLPTIPSSPALAGFLTNTATVTDNYNSKKGMAVGSHLPLYDADGAVQFEIQMQFALAAIPLIQRCLRGDGTVGLYGLPDICLFVGQSNANGIGYTDVYRFCKCNTLQIQLQSGSAQEIMATATFWPLARQVGSVMTPTRSQHRALGDPLFWHDVREVTLRGVNQRRAFAGATINVNHNLERKEIRPHNGQSDPTSLIPYEIMPHMQVVEGELSLHKQLAETYYTSGDLPRRWDELTFGISNAPRLEDAEDAKYFNLALENVVPVSRSKGGQEANAEVMYSTPFLADDLTISTDAPEEE